MKNLKQVDLSGSLLPSKANSKKFMKRFSKYLILLSVAMIVGVAIFWLWPKDGSSSVFDYVLGQENILKTDLGKVNVLLLGVAGGKHDGATLTDTIIVASYDLETKNVSMISLPRDLWVDDYKMRVNAIYQEGLSKNGGLQLAKEEVGQILGINIPYALRVDFNGFIKAVDLIGGVEVEVAKSFDDYVYPIEGKENDMCGYKEEDRDLDTEQAVKFEVEPGRFKVLIDREGNIVIVAKDPEKGIEFTDQQVANFFRCRFEHLKFVKGLTLMDGGTALKFVRSRHGTNGEGSDFARSSRQQLVISAFRQKVLSVGTLTDPQKISELIKTFSQSFETDIESHEYVEFVKLFKTVNLVRNYVIDGSGTSPLLVAPPPQNYGGAWVLVPTGGDYVKIHQFVSDIFTDVASSSGQMPQGQLIRN